MPNVLLSTVRLLIWGLAVLAVPAGLAREVEPPRLLVLFSNDRLLPANQKYDEGLREALEPQEGQPAVSFFAEFLDAIRLGGEEGEDAVERYLSERYHRLPPDAIVALGQQALIFLLERRDTLFAETPLLFGGVGKEHVAEIRNTAGVAGLPMDFSVALAVEGLLEMRPETQEILLVHGSSDFDRSWRELAARQCAAFADRARITFLPELPIPELKTRLGGLPERTAVVYLTYFQSPTGETYTPAHVAKELASVSAVPVMGPYDTYMGTGLLGVSASPFKDDGILLGKMVRRVLSGESPESIGIHPPSPLRLVLDDRQMQRWGIQSIPAAAEIRYRAPTLWEKHRSAVVAALVVVSVQTLLILGLVASRLRQKRTERELRFSEALFSGVFRGSPAAISIVRRSDGRIVDVNPGWETVTGVSRPEAIGRTPLELGMEIGGDAESRFREFLESGKSLDSYEQVHRTADGRTRILSLSAELHTLRDEPCYVVVAKDVTELREMEDAHRQIVHTSRLAMLGEMTASIAHEINQPLGAILSNTDAAEMLLERPVPPLDEMRAILSDIRRDDRRASEVIQRVRALAGRREVPYADFDLNGLLHEMADMVGHDARRRGVALVREFADGLPPVHGDAVQIQQVVLNLLLNAMDAMEDTPVAARQVVIRSGRGKKGTVEVGVADCGPGIPPEGIGRIFDSFYTTKKDGMGLGLSLARSIAEAHGGSIFAENNASKGATFSLILPEGSPLSDDEDR